MTYVPIEYPKMVPGADGPTVVQNEEEELAVLKGRVGSLSGCGGGGGSGTIAAQAVAVAHNPEIEWLPSTSAKWQWDRKTPRHDWIAALYRPYEPPV